MDISILKQGGKQHQRFFSFCHGLHLIVFLSLTREHKTFKQRKIKVAADDVVVCTLSEAAAGGLPLGTQLCAGFRGVFLISMFPASVMVLVMIAGEAMLRRLSNL